MLASRSLLPFLALVGLAVEAQARQVPKVPVVLDTLEAIYPFSKAEGMVSTPDGKYLYSAEGGGMAVLDTSLLQLGMDDPIKRFALGKEGPIAVRIGMDPDVGLLPGATDILMLAAGRDGLWVTGADVNDDILAAVNTVRIDDSGNLVVTTQSSRRWCCDVNFVTVGGIDYVVALFQKKNQSRLRFYRLFDVRTKFAAGIEMGNELVADLQVKLNARPNFTAPQTYGGSMALAMDIDVLDAPEGSEKVMIYVAMGHHGLARVEITPSDFTGGGPPTVEWGPVFGDNTWYHLNNPLNKDWYNNLEWKRGAILDRTEPPVFFDVLVHNDPQYGHYLYCAVDHLSWLRFDISGTWSEQMPIDHHEGTEVTNTGPLWDEVQVRMVPNDPINDPNDAKRYSYARELALAEPPSGSLLGPILVVTANDKASVMAFWQPTEGYSYDSSLLWGGVRIKPGFGHNVTAFYRVTDNWTDRAHNQVAYIEAGGSKLWVPSDQQGSSLDELQVFHNIFTAPLGPQGQGGFSVCNAFVDVAGAMGTTAPQIPTTYVRDTFLGQRPYTITFLEAEPDILLHGTNDAGAQKNGFLVTYTDQATGDLVVANRTNFPDQVDSSGSIGLIDEAVQWPDLTNSNRHYVMGNWKGAPGLEGEGARWFAMELNIPSTFDPSSEDTDDFPTEVMRAYIDDVHDRFDNPGRHQYMGSNRSRQMDEHYKTLTGVKEILVLTKGQPTPEGVVLIDREVYQVEIDDLNDVTGTIDPELAGMLLQENVPLITHPEYDWMDISDSTGDKSPEDWWKTGGPSSVNDPSGASGAIFNFPPTFFQVRNPDGGAFERWVLAVPCGKIWIDSNWDGFQPDWIQDATGAGPGVDYWEPKSGRPLIQFWPVEQVGDDLVVITQSTPKTLRAGNTGLARFIGTTPGLFYDVEAVRLHDGNDDEVFCFGVDFAGQLVITKITDILSSSPDTELPILWEWSPPPAIIDSLPNNVSGLSIDPFDDDGDGIDDFAYLYVSVRRMGIEVLRFDPDLLLIPNTNPLSFVQRIQTPGNAYKSTIRDVGGVKHLILADETGAVRVYGD